VTEAQRAYGAWADECPVIDPGDIQAADSE